MPRTACFRRFIRRTLSLRERACIESLERQRQRSGRVRALINDPSGALTRVLLEYLSWHQARLTQRSAVIISPRSTPHSPLKAKWLSRRRFPSLRGYCRPVGQIIIFQADKLKRLGQAVATVAPLLSSPDATQSYSSSAISNASLTTSPPPSTKPSTPQQNTHLQNLAPNP